MAKKQYYCIDYRNMHNAIHGLIVYNTRKEAEDAYIVLTRGLHEVENLVRTGDISEGDYEVYYNNLLEETFNSASYTIDEVNFNKYEYAIIRGKREKYYNNGYKHIIVNNMMSIDLYA